MRRYGTILAILTTALTLAGPALAASETPQDPPPTMPGPKPEVPRIAEPVLDRVELLRKELQDLGKRYKKLPEAERDAVKARLSLGLEELQVRLEQLLEATGTR